MSLKLEATTASVVVQLLEFLGELPSTPPTVAAEAHERAADLEELLPPLPRQQGPGARVHRGSVELDVVSGTAIAGLLELLAGLPSTPPSVIEDARAHSEALWERLPSGGE